MLDQFLHHPIDTRDELLEAYMVGQRLVKFLSVILPTHADYSNQIDSRAQAARERSLEQLAVVTKYIDQIALLIDKQEHEDYISSVINQHQDDSVQKREESYYADDVDGDSEPISTYLASSNARGSDSTERLNNRSTENSFASSNRDRSDAHDVPYTHINQIQRAYPPNDQNISVVSDSVDVLYDNSTSISKHDFVREDPVSTASHTILRVVSPYQDMHDRSRRASVQRESNSLHENKAVRDNVLPVDKSDESFSKNNGSFQGVTKQADMPMIRSHWVAANRSTKNVDISISSVDRSFGSNSRNNPVNVTADPVNVTADVSTSSMNESPGRSVRNIIRSWPPKQDPPEDPPGRNSTVRKEDIVVVKGSISPVDEIQPSIAEKSFDTAFAPQPEEIVTLQFKPMTDLQQMAAELDKASPSRDQPNVHKAENAPTFLTRRDPSIGSQLSRFSNSYSTTSCDRNEADENDTLPSAYSIKERHLVAPALDETEANESQIVSTTDFSSHTPADHNVSVDSLGFPKVEQPVPPPLTEHDISLEARIMSIASKAATSFSSKENRRDIPSSPENFDFPVQFESLEKSEAMINPSDKSSQITALSSTVTNITLEPRRSGPVDLDDSTSSHETTAMKDHAESANAIRRRFLTDGSEYVLPLPKGVSITKRSNPVLGSYAPPAADWSIDEERDTDSRRFVRENSNISIDSTEFSGHANTGNDKIRKDRSISEFPEPQDTVIGNSTDWTPVWSPHDFDSIMTSDRPKGKITDQSNTSSSSAGRPDLSYEAWDQVWNSAANRNSTSHSPDSRKEIIAKGNKIQKGEYCTDRTSSTGSSSSASRSKDVPQETGSSAKASALLDPFSSRTAIEAPFLRDEKESPLMIDSMTEQRLRLPMNQNGVFLKSSAKSLSLPPHNVGLYGSLKGFQSLDCILPFDHDNADQNVEYTRGSIMLCRSRAVNSRQHRSPNEDDWEESSLLMVDSQTDDPKFKSCVRCLLK